MEKNVAKTIKDTIKLSKMNFGFLIAIEITSIAKAIKKIRHGAGKKNKEDILLFPFKINLWIYHCALP